MLEKLFYFKFFITAKLSSKARGYNWNINITNIFFHFFFLFSFFLSIFNFSYKITKMYKSSFTANQGHVLAVCTAEIET